MSSSETVKLDGRHGEGGGQLLRTALSLSAITGRPVELKNIRAGRDRPGMAPQHLTAVDAAAAICGASVEGDRPRSTDLRFAPGHPPRAGDYRFDVADRAANGSAGSASLVLQTVLVPLAFARGSSKLHVSGGTHVAWSPPFHYLKDVYGAVLVRLGYEVEFVLHRWGFYPAGGGRIGASIQGRGPGWQPGGAALTDRGPLDRVSGFSAVGNLPHHVLERQRSQARDRLRERGFDPCIERRAPFSRGPGSVLYLRAGYPVTPAGFTGVGRQGKPAESVANEAVDHFLAHHDGACPVDPHLADQLLLPLAAGPSASVYRTRRITDHLRTNAHVVRRMTGREVHVQEATGTVRLPAANDRPEPNVGDPERHESR